MWAPARAGERGCRLATGLHGCDPVLDEGDGALPAKGTACFITDYLGARLTGEAPVTDPTMGASSGLFHLAERRWDPEMIRHLGLP
ncbi:MAG: FGGY family carbohydrate kinase [Marinilabiliales bacterium]|nr:FGGY family carbohydrate kinase [Marinilabiliales bacterium]